MERVAAEGEELAVDVPWVPPLLLDAAHGVADRPGDAREQRLEEGGVEAAQQADGILIGDRSRAEGGELVEQGDRVAHAPLPRAGDQPQRRVARADPLGLADRPQVGGEGGRGHAPEVEFLAARQDGRRHGVDLGGGEDEHQVRRRLLDDLEQRVEGLAREAVDLVEHHHLVAVAGRAVLQALGEIADLLDLGIGGGVDLDDVEVRAAGDLDAGGALVARIGRRAALAVERLGQHARRRGLADAADSGKKIGLSDAPFLERVTQSDNDRFLADEAGEILRAPLAREDLIRHRDGSGLRRVPVKLRHSAAYLIAAPFRA